MLLHSLWTGCGPEAATAAQQALLERYVSTPFSLRHIPIRLPTLRLGTQQIATFEMNADAPGPVVVWAHGAPRTAVHVLPNAHCECDADGRNGTALFPQLGLS